MSYFSTGAELQAAIAALPASKIGSYVPFDVAFYSANYMADYQGALDRLQARELTYRCFRTRKEIAEDIGRAPHGAMEAFRGAALPRHDEHHRHGEHGSIPRRSHRRHLQHLAAESRCERADVPRFPYTHSGEGSEGSRQHLRLRFGLLANSVGDRGAWMQGRARGRLDECTVPH